MTAFNSFAAKDEKAVNTDIAWEVSTGFSVLNSPAAMDLNGDNLMEVILTDVEGKIGVFSGTNGQIWWTKKKNNVSFTSAIVGNFLNNATPCIAVAGNDGKLYLFNANTGADISVTEIGGVFNLPPTLYEISTADNTIIEDAVILVDQNGVISVVQIEPSLGKGRVSYQYRTETQISLPLITDRIVSENQDDILAVTSMGDLIVYNPILNKDAIRYYDKLNTKIKDLPALVDISGDKKKEIISINGRNYINVFSYKDNELSIIYSEKPIDQEPVSDLCSFFTEKNSKISVAIPTKYNLYLFDPIEKKINLSKENITSSCFYTKPALIEDNSGVFYFVVADENKSVFIINLDTSNVEKEINYNEQLGLSPLIYNIDKNGKAVIVFTTAQSAKLVAFKTNITLKNFPIEIEQEKSSFFFTWFCHAGNSHRYGRFDLDYSKKLKMLFTKSRSQKVEHLEKAKEAFNKHKWQLAIDEAEKYLLLDSQNTEALQLKKNAWIRKNLLPIILICLLLLFLITIALYRLALWLSKIYAFKKAQAFVEIEKYKEAIPYIKKTLSKDAKNKTAMLMLVDVLSRIEEYKKEDIPYFEAAIDISNHQSQYVKTLAEAYCSLEITTDKSLEILLEALDMFDDKDKSQIEYLIGKCYQKQNHYDLAAKYLRSAIRGDFEESKYFESLTDIYLDMKFHTAKALPVFEKVYNSRREDIKFLEAMCEACIDAKRTNGSAKEICLQTISKNPKFIPAYILLARIDIRSGKIKEAINHINKILVIDSENSEGLFLLSQCYLIDGQQDKKAIETYLKTLKKYPDNPDILKTLTHIYFYDKKFDEDSADIYLRTYKVLPNDTTALFALAKINEERPNVEIVIPVIEKLIEQNQAKSIHYLQLARAYASQNVIEEKAERIYKEALKNEPENISFILLLAETLCSKKREDAEAAAIYEKALKHDKTNYGIGKQLAITYCKLGRFSQAASLSQVLLKIKEDDELKRNYALANLHDNKLDDAIAEYKLLLEKNKEDKDVIVNLAQAYAQKGNLDPESVSIYQKALKLAPDNEDVHLIMAYIYLTNNDTTNCIEELNIILKTKPQCTAKVVDKTLEFLNEFSDEVKLRWFLVSLLINANRLREAIEQLENIFENDPEQIKNIIKAFDMIIQKDPKNAFAYLNRGVMLKIQGDFLAAKKNLETAYEILPSNIDVQNELKELYEFLLEEKDDNETRFKLGKLYYLTADYDKAIGCFQKTSQHFKWESESIKMLGKCFVGKGMLDLALQEFKKLVIDEELKSLFYDLAQKFEAKKDLVGAKTVYKILFAADINYKNVKAKFEMLAGSTSDPITFEKTAILSSLSEATKRRYELLEEVGRGAMGIVYKAKDKELDEIVALKILPDSLSNNPEAVSRFKSEARSARRLSHQHIVRIHDIGEELGRKYISMEFVDGIDLKKKIKNDGVPPLKQVIEWFRQIAEALSYAHSIGIIHRDIKPANMMITKDNKIKITDFGIAKITESGEATIAGAILGTPIYMSPEQVQGIPVDNRADLYSFGIMMYEICSGHPPFTDNLAYQHLHSEPAPLPDSVPKPLQNIIMKCLKKKREDRWKTAEEITIHLNKLKDTI